MSETNKIIESLKNSGRKVEEFYTGNKTSDKNVGSIDEDVKRCNELTKVKHANWIGISNQLAISHILAEREQMLKERDVANDSVIAHKFAVMQQQLEQKDKRIQELEEETAKLKAHHVFTRNEATDEEKAELYDVIDKTLDTFLEKEKPIWQQEMKTDKMSLEEALNVVDSMYQDRYKIIRENDTIFVDRLKDVKFTNLEFASVILLREVQSLQSKLKKSITKQDIKDLIKNETIDISGFECIAVEDLEKIIGG